MRENKKFTVEDCKAKLKMEGRIFRCMRPKTHIGVHRHSGLTEGITDTTKAFILEWADDAPLPTYITRQFKTN